jgi:hypothetical protein
MAGETPTKVPAKVEHGSLSEGLTMRRKTPQEREHELALAYANRALRPTLSTVGIKTITTGTAAGLPAVEVSIAADTPDEQVRVMIRQAVYAYTELYAGALGAAEVAPKLTGVPRGKRETAK